MVVQSFPVKHASYLHIIQNVTEEKVCNKQPNLSIQTVYWFIMWISKCANSNFEQLKGSKIFKKK